MTDPLQLHSTVTGKGYELAWRASMIINKFQELQASVLSAGQLQEPLDEAMAIKKAVEKISQCAAADQAPPGTAVAECIMEMKIYMLGAEGLLRNFESVIVSASTPRPRFDPKVALLQLVDEGRSWHQTTIEGAQKVVESIELLDSGMNKSTGYVDC